MTGVVAMMSTEMDSIDDYSAEHPPDERPIRLTVTDDLERSRLTVLFRGILVIPHLLFVLLWGIAALSSAVIVWLAVLFEGRAPRSLHGFIASYVRYATHVGAYLSFLADPYPGFTGSDPYPVDVTIAAPERQGRLGAACRLILALPALLLAGMLAGGPVQSAASVSSSVRGSFSTGGALFVVALLGWFACLARGSMPRGLRDLGTYAVGYGAQTTGYLLLLTDHYPTTDPAAVEPAQDLPSHPVRIEVNDDLARSRLTVFFRLLLALPHFVWLFLWGALALLAAVVAWLVALVTGRVPLALHRFLAAFTRYSAHVYSFFFLVGGPFPGFVGAAGSYPIDLQIDPPTAQGRLVTLTRLVLALPALLVSGVLTGVLYLVGILGWGAALVRGRMPEGLHNLGAACVRYNAQMAAYLLLVTPRYPYAAPALRDRPRPVKEPALDLADFRPPSLGAGAEAEPG